MATKKLTAWNRIGRELVELRIPFRALAMVGVLAVAAVLAGSIVASADDGADFYRGKQVSFIVGGSAGGGYDAYSRTVVRTMKNHLPGKPTFVVQNMRGGGGKIAANHLYNVAARDGSAFGMVGRAMGIQKLVDPADKAVKFDALKFNWLGSVQSEVGLVMVRDFSKVNTFDDLMQKKVVVSATGRAAPPSFFPMMLSRFFDAKFDIVRGYKGSQAALLAMEKGEAEGHVSGSASALIRQRIMPWINSGKVKVVLLIGTHGDPDFKGVPTVVDIAKTEKQKAILEVILTQQTMAWPIVAPPGVPAERIKLLRAAFDATMADPDFLADAKRQDLGLNPVSGEKIQALLEKVYASSKETLNDVASLLAKK